MCWSKAKNVEALDPDAGSETRARTGPDGVPGHGHGRRHREVMARPGLEPVRTASPVVGMDAVTAR